MPKWLVIIIAITLSSCITEHEDVNDNANNSSSEKEKNVIEEIYLNKSDSKQLHQSKKSVNTDNDFANGLIFKKKIAKKENISRNRNNQTHYLFNLFYLKSKSASDSSIQYNSRHYEPEFVIVKNPSIGSIINPWRSVAITFDNDLFNNCDRYYTNGFILKYTSPAFAFWRINTILPVAERESIEYNSIELQHAMYTPYTTKTPPLLKSDRPYASTMFIRFSRSSERLSKGIVQIASIDAGVIGQAALGSLMQEGVHSTLPTNDKPLGWETQIANDIILNYHYQLIKNLASHRFGHIFSFSSASLGTLLTSVSTGIGFKIGHEKHFIVPLQDHDIQKDFTDNRKIRFSLQAKFQTSLVGYNATLNGGLLNKNNIYVLKAQEIEKLVFNSEVMISVSTTKYSLTLAQYFISKEFKEGKNHYWGQIGLYYQF